MGTDRMEVHKGPCICGAGEVKINFCTPDHPWPTKSKWFETSVSCKNCNDNYGLIEQNNRFVFVKKSDVKFREDLWSEYSSRSDKLLMWPQTEKILKRLELLLDNQPSMAACHRLLSVYRLYNGSVSTFRKKWNGAAEWIRSNVRVYNLESVMRLLEIEDNKISQELSDLKILWDKHQRPLPIEGDPIMDTSPYME